MQCKKTTEKKRVFYAFQITPEPPLQAALLHKHNNLPIPITFPIFVQRAVPLVKRRALQKKLQLAVADKTFEVSQHLDAIGDGALLHPSGHPEAVGRNVLEDEGAGGDLRSFPGPEEEGN